MARSTSAAPLADVAAAIDAGDFPGALAGALGAWRGTPCAVLADLVDAIAARCRPAAIAGRGALAFQRAWMQLAGGKPSPVAIGALAAAIAKNIPVAKVGTYSPDRDLRRYKAFLDRVAALAKLPRDPRIASAVIDMLERAPFSIESGRRIYQPAVDLVVKIADERSVARLRAIVERPTSKHALVRAYFAEALPPASEAIEAIERAGTAEPDELATSLLAILSAGVAKRRAARDVDQLMAECLAHPDDDGPREVLADALLERDDPRGEFISLQLREAREPLADAQRKRMAALLRTHEKAWLGDLAAVTKHRVWRRGFLEQAELARNSSAEQATWERAVKDPRLATIRLLAKGGGNATHYESFVMSPAMRGLREFPVMWSEMLEAIAVDRRVEAIDVQHDPHTTTFKALASAVERTGVTRIIFSTNLIPAVLLARIAKLRGRDHVRELCARPSRRVAEIWSRDPWRWLGAHALVGVPRLSLDFTALRVIAETTERGLALDIDARRDWLIETIVGNAPKLASVVLRGGDRIDVVRSSVRKPLAALGNRLATHGDWTALTTDRGRARRARRS